MAAAIGAQSFDSWDGFIVKAPPRYGTYAQVGVDGVGVTFGGRDPGEQTISTIKRGTDLASATALENAYRLLEKTAVTVVDPPGRTFTTVVICATMSTIFQDPLGFLIRTQWKLIITADNPA